MSGPKISVYQLSEQQLQNLRGQIRCDQQSIVCVEQIKRFIGSLRGFGGQLETLQDTLDLLQKRAGGFTSEIDTLRKMQDDLARDCSYLTAELLSNTTTITGNYALTEDALTEKKSQLAKLKGIQSRAASSEKSAMRIILEIDGKAKSGLDSMQNDIVNDIAAVSSFYIEPEKTEAEQLEDSRKSIEAKLRAMLTCGECPSDVKPDISGALSALTRIADTEHLRTFEALTVIPLKRKYETALERRREALALYEDLKARHSALCSAAQATEKSFSADSAGIEALKSEIALLEKQLITQAEQGYISDCVNEAMAEMGYDLIGDRTVTKRSGKRFKNELFSYADGTAINVTYASDGQIAMELGGIDQIDRIPTRDESDALCEHMDSFCGDFKVLEEKLKAKGVLVKSRVSMCPPSAEYAAIINVDDYNVKSQKPTAVLNVTDKRKKTSVKQVLRRVDN